VQHVAVLAWLDGLDAFCTCPLVELGFLRVSMSPAFRVSFADAAQVLADIKQRRGWSAVNDDVDTAALPTLTSHSDVTDAYLVALARSKMLRLATMDMALCAQSWAAEIAFNPLMIAKPPQA
jgi:predicted nucleic acid-binding protein